MSIMIRRLPNTSSALASSGRRPSRLVVCAKLSFVVLKLSLMIVIMTTCSLTFSWATNLQPIPMSIDGDEVRETINGQSGARGLADYNHINTAASIHNPSHFESIRIGGQNQRPSSKPQTLDDIQDLGRDSSFSFKKIPTTTSTPITSHHHQATALVKGAKPAKYSDRHSNELKDLANASSNASRTQMTQFETGALYGPDAIDQVDVSESKHQEHGPNCALILKRTYILKGNHDEWGEKFVFNDADLDDKTR